MNDRSVTRKIFTRRTRYIVRSILARDARSSDGRNSITTHACFPPHLTPLFKGSSENPIGAGESTGAPIDRTARSGAGRLFGARGVASANRSENPSGDRCPDSRVRKSSARRIGNFTTATRKGNFAKREEEFFNEAARKIPIPSRCNQTSRCLVIQSVQRPGRASPRNLLAKAACNVERIFRGMRPFQASPDRLAAIDVAYSPCYMLR